MFLKIMFFFLFPAKIHSTIHWTAKRARLWYRFWDAIRWQWRSLWLGFQAKACVSWCQFPITVVAATELLWLDWIIPFIQKRPFGEVDIEMRVQRIRIPNGDAGTSTWIELHHRWSAYYIRRSRLWPIKTWRHWNLSICQKSIISLCHNIKCSKIKCPFLCFPLDNLPKIFMFFFWFITFWL